MEKSEEKMEDSETDNELYPAIIKEGWLMKRGEHFRNWRPRYDFYQNKDLFIKNESFRYFILKDDGQFLGYKSKPVSTTDPNDRCNNFTVKGCQTMVADQPKPCAFALR